jgi:hypothetical protein
VADGGGLENRYGARVSSWVRIPHPPLTSHNAVTAVGGGAAVSGRTGQRADTRSCSCLPDEPGERLGGLQMSLGEHVLVVVGHGPGRMTELLLADLRIHPGVPRQRGGRLPASCSLITGRPAAAASSLNRRDT